MPMSTGLIADFYEDLDRAAMMGWQSAVVNFGGLVFMFTGGILAAIHWNQTFLAYSIGLPIAIWVLIKLPEPEKTTFTEGKSSKIPGNVYALIAGVFLFNILFFTLMTNTSVMISKEGLGDASQAGAVLTMFMVGGFIAGVAFGKTVLVFKNFVNAIGWLATGTGMLLIAFSHNLPLIVAGAFIAGSGMATTMPSYLIKVAVLAPPSAISVAYAYFFCFVGTGQFISPLLFELILPLFNQEIGRFPILISAIVLLIYGLVSLILTAVSIGNNTESINKSL